MFGCIVAGRLVQTNFQQVDPTKFLIELEKAQDINHIVVFMTGQQPFPEGYAATVHFLWPTSENPHWQLLGMISNEKPSAVFRLGGKKSTSTTFSMSGHTGTLNVNSGALNTSSSITAQLGISIEPVHEVLNQCSPSSSSGTMVLHNSQIASSNSGNTLNIASKIAQNLFDYCASFVSTLPMGGMSIANIPQESMFIPMKTLQEWFNSVQRKLTSDPNYFSKSA